MEAKRYGRSHLPCKWFLSFQIQLCWRSWNNSYKWPLLYLWKAYHFKKRLYDFKPIKEDFREVLICVKFLNLSLCCWFGTEISKIASNIKVSLTIDLLNVNRMRLTFNRVTVQVDIRSILPDSIIISVKGEDFIKFVIYDFTLQNVCHILPWFSSMLKITQLQTFHPYSHAKGKKLM